MYLVVIKAICHVLQLRQIAPKILQLDTNLRFKSMSFGIPYRINKNSSIVVWARFKHRSPVRLFTYAVVFPCRIRQFADTIMNCDNIFKAICANWLKFAHMRRWHFHSSESFDCFISQCFIFGNAIECFHQVSAAVPLSSGAVRDPIPFKIRYWHELFNLFQVPLFNIAGDKFNVLKLKPCLLICCAVFLLRLLRYWLKLFDRNVERNESSYCSPNDTAECCDPFQSTVFIPTSRHENCAYNNGEECDRVYQQRNFLNGGFHNGFDNTRQLSRGVNV